MDHRPAECDMSAVLQFEFDRARAAKMPGTYIGTTLYAEGWYREVIIKHAVADTLCNGGTFVLVVSETTITVVQRAEAEKI